jgi:hypothetical protein
MGKRQDWPITVPFLNRRSRRGRRDVGDCMAHSPRRGGGEGQGGFMRSTIPFSSTLGLATME